jgi:hypothetical protein
VQVKSNTEDVQAPRSPTLADAEADRRSGALRELARVVIACGDEFSTAAGSNRT